MRPRPITLLLGAAIVAGVVMIAMRLERYSEAVDRGYSPEARQNPYLAAQLLAARHDRQVTSHVDLAPLDELEQYEVLFLARSSQIISQARLQRLLDWVANGGRLVVAASYAYPWHSDMLLEHFQLSSAATHYQGRPIFDDSGQLIEHQDDHADDFERRQTAEALQAQLETLRSRGGNGPPTAAAAVAAYQARIPPHELLALDWLGVELTARFDPAIALEHPWIEQESAPAAAAETAPSWYMSGAQGVHIAGFEWGRGETIVLSDGGPFTSLQIDKFDHAELWRQLLGEGRRLAIIYGAQMPSLWTVLLRYMPEVMLAFGCWLGLWLWRQARRFGPIVQPLQGGRRSRLEHLAARGDYLWRGRQRAALLAPARQDLLRRARQTLPDFATLDAAEQSNALARLAGLDTASVTRALSAEPTGGDTAFVEIVQLLQRIRNAL